MTPELSRWLARVVNTRWFQAHQAERLRLREGALTEGWETLDDLPKDLRELGTRALRQK